MNTIQDKTKLTKPFKIALNRVVLIEANETTLDIHTDQDDIYKCRISCAASIDIKRNLLTVS